MTTSDRPLSLLTDSDRIYLRILVLAAGGDYTARNGKTTATLYRAADQTLRGIVPVQRHVRFAPVALDRRAPTIREILDSALLYRMCPHCGREFFGPDAECGGVGEGNCAGILAALSDEPEAEWDSLDTDEPYPGDEAMRVYRARYDAFAATLK